MIRILRAANDGGGSPADIVMDTVPDPRYIDRTIDAYDDIDIKGDQEELPEGIEPELAGKSREELLAEISSRTKAAQEAQTRVDPIGTLNQNFERFLGVNQPKQEVVEGWRTSRAPTQQIPQTVAEQEAWKRKMADKFLDDPVAAQQELMGQSLLPILSQVAENQAMQSREMAMLNPDTKDIFSRYSAEVEREVQGFTVQEKLQNPRVYQNAIERVKARHMSELVAEQSKANVDALLAERLKELGIDPSILGKGSTAPQRPAAPSLASPGGQRPPNLSPRTTIRVNPAQMAQIKKRADALGVSPEAMVARMREKGEL